MKTKRFPYRVTVAWSNGDNLYVARVPKLAGILGLDERDPAKAIRKAIQRGWDAVAALADNGHPLPEPDDWSKSPQANSMFDCSQTCMPLYENGLKKKE